MAEQEQDLQGGAQEDANLGSILSEIRSLKRSIDSRDSVISERGKKARLQPGETLNGNGPLRGYNRTLPLVEQVETLAALMPAEGEALHPEKAKEAHEIIKKGALSC